MWHFTPTGPKYCSHITIISCLFSFECINNLPDSSLLCTAAENAEAMIVQHFSALACGK